MGVQIFGASVEEAAIFMQLLGAGGRLSAAPGTFGRQRPRANWCQLLIRLGSPLDSEVRFVGEGAGRSAASGSRPIICRRGCFSLQPQKLRQGRVVRKVCVCMCVCVREIECYRREAGCFLFFVFFCQWASFAGCNLAPAGMMLWHNGK